MRIQKASSAMIAVALGVALLAGCSQTNNSNTTSDTTGATTGSSVTASAVAASSISDVDISFDSDDTAIDWKNTDYTTVDMSAGSQTISKSGTYVITGTQSDGSLIVDVDKDSDEGTVILVLNNTSITSASSAPIYVKDAQKVVVILADGTTNTLNQGSNVAVNEDEEPSAALFSKADLTITGSGTLFVTSDYNDGITSKDTLKITGGTLVVEAVGDGIVGKDYLAVQTADITVTAGKDGLRSTNDTDAGRGSILIEDGTFNITAANDAIQAYSVLQIDGGSFNLVSGGGYSGVISTDGGFGQGMNGGQRFQMDGTSMATEDQTVTQTDTQETQISTLAVVQTATQSSDTSSTSDSMKGLKATGGILISGGDFTISSYEDAVHSNGSIDISGGTMTLQSGDDAIHADGDVTLSGGTITIENSYEGIEGTTITVTGGTISVTSSDDGFNVNNTGGMLTIGGGDIYINAGGDGLDSNASVTMTGGNVTVDGPTDNGNGAIDYNDSFTISGGTLVATGSSGMAQVPGNGSSQPSILMYYTSTQTAGTAVTLKDSNGTVVATFTPSKQYNSSAISAPGLAVGQSYTLYSGSTEVVTFTISDTVTYLNESGTTTNQGMTGGFGGGQFPDSGQSGQFPGGGGQMHGGGPGRG